MTRRGWTTTAAVLGAAVALAAPAGAQEQDGGLDPTIASGKAQRSLDAARARWKAAHVSTYRFRVALGCFCPPDVRAPHTLTVRRGSPVKPPEVLADVATVPRLFRKIQGAIDGKAAALQVTYGARGVPTSISIDRSRLIADEEQYYTVDRFKKLPR